MSDLLDELAEAAPEAPTPIKMRVRETIVLRIVGKALVPFILLFALYVQFHGDYGPGGGFQAGVIFAAAFVLYALVFGLSAARRVASPWRWGRAKTAASPSSFSISMAAESPNRRLVAGVKGNRPLSLGPLICAHDQ